MPNTNKGQKESRRPNDESTRSSQQHQADHDRELAHGSRLRREEGEETEIGGEIRDRRDFEEGDRPPPVALEP